VCLGVASVGRFQTTIAAAEEVGTRRSWGFGWDEEKEMSTRQRTTRDYFKSN